MTLVSEAFFTYSHSFQAHSEAFFACPKTLRPFFKHFSVFLWPSGLSQSIFACSVPSCLFWTQFEAFHAFLVALSPILKRFCIFHCSQAYPKAFFAYSVSLCPSWVQFVAFYGSKVHSKAFLHFSETLILILKRFCISRCSWGCSKAFFACSIAISSVFCLILGFQAPILGFSCLFCEFETDLEVPFAFLGVSDVPRPIPKCF